MKKIDSADELKNGHMYFLRPKNIMGTVYAKFIEGTIYSFNKNKLAKFAGFVGDLENAPQLFSTREDLFRYVTKGIGAEIFEDDEDDRRQQINKNTS